MRPLPAPSHTLSDLLAVYARDYLPHKAPRTQYQERLLYRWFAIELGSIPLADLTPLVLCSWRESLRQSYKPGTIRHYLMILSAVLTAGVDNYGWLVRNPMRHKALRPPAAPGRERCLTADELVRLLAVCEASSNRLLSLAVVVALSTATRKNELLQRTWSDVDLERRLLSIPLAKNGERRAIPLVPQALALLQAHAARATSPWVFARKDGVRPLFIDYAWRCACIRAGLVDFHFHDLRHTTATYLAMSGAREEDIRQVLGHKTVAQTRKYIHLIEPLTRGVLQKMADAFLAGTLFVSTLTMLESVWLTL